MVRAADGEGCVGAVAFGAPPGLAWSPLGGPETFEFEERDGKTVLTSRARFSTKAERDGILESGMVDGAEQTYDRLDEYLTVMRQPAR